MPVNLVFTSSDRRYERYDRRPLGFKLVPIVTQPFSTHKSLDTNRISETYFSSPFVVVDFGSVVVGSGRIGAEDDNETTLVVDETILAIDPEAAGVDIRVAFVIAVVLVVGVDVLVIGVVLVLGVGVLVVVGGFVMGVDGLVVG